MALARIAFERACDSIFYDFLPDDAFPESSSRSSDPLSRAFDDLVTASRKAQEYAFLLSSGVNIADYKKFQSHTPSIRWGGDGLPFVIGIRPEEADIETTKWVIEFVIATIVHWQTDGLNPHVQDAGWVKQKNQRIGKT